MTTVSLHERIQLAHDTLSKRQQLVAAFVLRDPSFVATHSANEVGKRIGVSETTVIRFCHAFDYSGFAAFQKDVLRQLFQKNESTLHTYLHDKSDDHPHVQALLSDEAKRMQQMARSLDDDTFQRASRSLHEARTIYIVGYGSSQIAAQWFHFTLNLLRADVVHIEGNTGSWIRALRQLGPEDVVCLFSFHRYFKEPVHFAEDIRPIGCRTIAFTDSSVAPIIPFADDVFLLEQPELSTIDAMPTLLALLNALAAQMTACDPDHYEKQRIAFENVHDRFISERWT